MKSKIAVRLILYFSTALLLFSLVIGMAFTLLFSRHTMELHREDLQARAETIAQTMYGFLGNAATGNTDEGAGGAGTGRGKGSGGGGGGSGKGAGKGTGKGNGAAAAGTEHASSEAISEAEDTASEAEEGTAAVEGVQQALGVPHGSGFGAYMRFLGDIAMTDVWVVDSQSKTITPGAGHVTVEYGDLPADGETVIDRALAGEASFSESFSSVLGAKSISVGVPIREKEGAEPIGAVLLHSPVQSVSDAVGSGLSTLGLSALAALCLAIPAAILLSVRFTRPLRSMKTAARRLADGEYEVKTNITQKDEIGELAGTIDELADRLKETSRERQRLEGMRRDFISNISHELRTPVTVMRGSLEALCDGVVTEPTQIGEYHAQLLQESRHMQRLVDDLLELSRLQNTDFSIESAPLELNQLAQDVTRGMRRLAQDKNITLQLRTEEESLPFLGDYSRLRQMLIIIIDNALKFSPRDSAVELSLFRQSGAPVLKISDHGSGIAPQEIPLLFQRFHHSGGEENKTGTGLGLPIAKEIAGRHGIEILVESCPGNTAFTFVFPAQ